jgi:glycine hydroxymethyltransferase
MSTIKDFFTHSISKRDEEIFQSLNQEFQRQQEEIELIASENYVSKAVMEVQGSVLTNKYAEGYPGKRYYGGCEFVDKAEVLAIERLKKLFGCNFANVQPHSGANANQAVYLAFMKPGETVMGLDLNCGGHLTHGFKVNQSGKWFNPVSYKVNSEGLIDYEEVEKLAMEHKPKMLIAGFSAYSRKLDFAKFREIADKCGAILLADIAHVAGLVAAGEYPSPFPHAHVVTSTTHKTLRGPRGGIIMWNDEALSQKINSAIFPGTQGGPLMHIIAAKAVAFGEALRPEFTTYTKQVIANAKILSQTLVERGLKIVTGGTENHLIIVDLTPYNITGKDAEKTLENAGLTCNKNTIPFDQKSPMITSGIRIGTPAGTTRGFKEEEFKLIGNLIADVLTSLVKNPIDNSKSEKEVLEKVKSLCKQFPIY